MEKTMAETASPIVATDEAATEEHDPELEAYDAAWSAPDAVTERFVRWDRFGRWACLITIAAGAAWLTLRSLF